MSFTRKEETTACTPSAKRGQNKKVAVCKPASKTLITHQTGWHLDLGLPASRAGGNKCLLLKSPCLLKTASEHITTLRLQIGDRLERRRDAPEMMRRASGHPRGSHHRPEEFAVVTNRAPCHTAPGPCPHFP